MFPRDPPAASIISEKVKNGCGWSAHAICFGIPHAASVMTCERTAFHISSDVVRGLGSVSNCFELSVAASSASITAADSTPFCSSA
eukprot:563159-Rhodomonas_salina.1